MTYSHAKVQSQRLDCSKDGVETSGQMGRVDCIIFLANAVGDYKVTDLVMAGVCLNGL